MKKRILTAFLAVMLLLCAVPAGAVLEEDELQITWCPGYRYITRLYGTDRMLARGESGSLALLDLYGNQITQAQYDAFTVDGDGNATALKDGKWGRVDLNGNEIVPFEYTRVADIPGRSELPAVSNDIPEYPEGLRSVNEDGRTGGLGAGPWGFENEEGELVVPCVFDTVGEFDRGFALVRKDGVYGMLKNPVNEDQVSAWAAEEVESAREAGLLGDRTSSYYLYYITRLQFAELAVNLVEQRTGEEIQPARVDRFSDADDIYVRKAAAAGIVTGTGEDGNTFEPDALVTREQLAAMLYRALEYTGCTLEAAELEDYSDAERLSEWAAEPVAALVGAGILQGNANGALSPLSYTTVEQAIVMVMRAYDQ